MSIRQGTLVLSSNSGRYALEDTFDDVEDLDITAGLVCDIKLGEGWIHGSVEHAGQIYAKDGIPAGYGRLLFHRPRRHLRPLCRHETTRGVVMTCAWRALSHQALDLTFGSGMLNYT